MKRAIFLATTAALVAMLILAPMVMAQGSAPEVSDGMTLIEGVGGGPTNPPTGGPAVLLPAAVLLLGSGILTYAILRRR